MQRVVGSYSPQLSRFEDFTRAVAASSRNAKAREGATYLGRRISEKNHDAGAYFGGVLPVLPVGTSGEFGDALSLFNAERPAVPEIGKRRGTQLSYTPAFGAESAIKGVPYPEDMAEYVSRLFRNKGVGASSVTAFGMKKSDSGLLVPDTKYGSGLIHPEYAQRYMSVMRKADTQLKALHGDPQEMLDAYSEATGHSKARGIRRFELATKAYAALGPQFMQEPTEANDYELRAHGYHVGALGLAHASGIDMSASDDEVAEAMHRSAAIAAINAGDPSVPGTEKHALSYVTGVLDKVTSANLKHRPGSEFAPDRVRGDIQVNPSSAVVGTGERQVSPEAVDATISSDVSIGGVNPSDPKGWTPVVKRQKVAAAPVTTVPGEKAATRNQRQWRHNAKAKSEARNSEEFPVARDDSTPARAEDVAKAAAKQKKEQDAKREQERLESDAARHKNLEDTKKADEFRQSVQLKRLVGYSFYMHNHPDGPVISHYTFSKAERRDPDVLKSHLSSLKEKGYWWRAHTLAPGQKIGDSGSVIEAGKAAFSDSVKSRVASGEVPG